jgi:fatty-acyl-CoA synthase
MLSFEPLTPTAFLQRSAEVFGDRTAVVDGDRRFTYAELHDRSGRLAGGLRVALGVKPGDRVAVLAPNTHLLLESHYGVPLAGAVLVALNYRLSASELGAILRHSGATVLLCDFECRELGVEAIDQAGTAIALVTGGPGATDYEQLVRDARPERIPVEDECGLLALNYTSGTTGDPKGVMYHHRGAYLQSLSQVIHTRLDASSVFLWTLPMFHCNGWCFTWAVTAAGATHHCLRKVEAATIWRLIRDEGITHFNAAPTVLSMVAWDEAAEARPSSGPLRVGTGGAPPSPALLERMAALNIEVTHLYGLTETFGPAVVCEWRPEWNDLPLADQAKKKARQGVPNVIGAPLRVIDGSGADVPPDGLAIGEVALRGNNVMLGYYRDEEATQRAAPDGWFRTGDLGVRHPDGYVELRDRSKDIIISGGENIASIEVEQALASHPAVLEAAVVAVPDERWGEVPVAFITLHSGMSVDASELTGHVRQRLAHFKVPKHVHFTELPKTSTGKVQKYVLREWARDLPEP